MMRNLLTTLFAFLLFLSAAKAGDGGPGAPVIKAYPNPTTGVFYCQLPAGASKQVLLEIYSPVGALVQRRTLEGSSAGAKVTIDLRNQPKGLYYLRVNGHKAVPVVII